MSENEEEWNSRPTSSRHSASSSQYYYEKEKRAHHNALERKRRDHIKYSFSRLSQTIPTLRGQKASRFQILNKTSEYIDEFLERQARKEKQLADIIRQNGLLEAQIEQLEKIKADLMLKHGLEDDSDDMSSYVEESVTDSSEEEDDDEEEEVHNNSIKRIKRTHVVQDEDSYNESETESSDDE